VPDALTGVQYPHHYMYVRQPPDIPSESSDLAIGCLPGLLDESDDDVEH